MSAVDHPKHYTAHPSGVECIALARELPFALGNFVKYVWRAGLKSEALEDLQKARWYLREHTQHPGVVRVPTRVVAMLLRVNRDETDVHRSNVWLAFANDFATVPANAFENTLAAIDIWISVLLMSAEAA